MSATKIRQPVYKVFEPGYHPQRTIIVDDEIESPETLTIRLEEAARNGGDLGGPCPSGLLPMSAFKAQPPQLHGYADSTYSQYPAQPFSAQQTENAASQINQVAFAANSNATAEQYLAAQAAPGININVLSWHPRSGSPGTKVSLKVTSQHDLLGNTMTAPPFVSLLFGSQRCSAQVTRDSRSGGSGCTYTITTKAPQLLSAGYSSLGNVPLTLLVEDASGEELARVANIGGFTYHDAQGVAPQGNVAAGTPGDNSPPDLASPKTRSPVHRASPPHQDLETKTTSPVANHALAGDSSTNAYGFPPNVSVANAAAQIHAQAPIHSDFAAGTYNQGGSNMLSGYRGSFTDHYARSPPVLRSPHGAGWMFGSQIDPARGSTPALPHAAHASIARPSLTPLQHSSPATPQLARTSTLAQSAGNGLAGYGVYHEKVTLKIVGDLGSMAEGWSQEEWENKRRLVLFRKQQTGSTLTLTFKPVRPAERPPHSICVSCIWWEEKQACYITSVDTIHLLEQILAAPSRFGVEEKNRIRRNLEGFQPTTVSKSRSESEEFFKVIMGFGNPKPRNIEKDVKVFQWKDLSSALFKIISKYSASTTAVMSPNSASHIATSAAAGFPALPPTPVSTPSTATTNAVAAASYAAAGHHHHHHHHHHPDSIASPRALASAPPWPAYGAAAKAMSPALKTSSPSALRISTLPVVYDHRGTTHSLTSPYGLPGPAHHSPHHGHGAYSHSAIPASQGQTRNWDGYAADGGSYPAQSGSTHSQVYGGAAYADGGPRA
ncbi:hypothetical protein MMYC01_201711 [Madurella mycetomatis]|uniref:DUF7082 domain-containing protein n=1 Tax=Madurella mycetomatis TaxID=100816 RepID=A0A175WEU2_9PEZI|nr:hypothetical protein MMYC01_201711 [Madurella mycetomatis]